MTVYLFTIPVKFDRDVHPLGATPDDLIEVDASSELDARLRMNRVLGPDSWCSVIEHDDTHSLSCYPGKRIRL